MGYNLNPWKENPKGTLNLNIVCFFLKQIVPNSTKSRKECHDNILDNKSNEFLLDFHGIAKDFH